jgi:hypothetical protein
MRGGLIAFRNSSHSQCSARRTTLPAKLASFFDIRIALEKPL